jgi:hypothetical protein
MFNKNVRQNTIFKLINYFINLSTMLSGKARREETTGKTKA